MVLVSGPTGSGKSTTLYATVNELNVPTHNTITVEDPIEYRIAGIKQTQVNARVGYTFANGLRAALRADPDVILIGEIRDIETARIAAESALTGHLVMSTLHANDAASSTIRLMDMGLEPYLVTSALECVVAQRLLRKFCRRCRVNRPASDEELLEMHAMELIDDDAFGEIALPRRPGMLSVRSERVPGSGPRSRGLGDERGDQDHGLGARPFRGDQPRRHRRRDAHLAARRIYEGHGRGYQPRRAQAGAGLAPVQERPERRRSQRWRQQWNAEPVSKPAPATVVDLVRARASDPTTGVLAGDRRFAWDEVVARSEATAHLLVALRSGTPFHVGILMDNSPDYLFTLFGAALAGATSVGINNTRRGEQLAIDILHTDCQLVICDAENASLLAGLDLGATEVHVASSPEWSTRVDTLIGRDAVDVPVQRGDLFTLIFTSGSTGAPKAVRMTHGRASELATTWSSVGPEDVAYCAIPLFHTNALMSMALPALNSGGAIALKDRFSASQFMPDIRRYGATFFSTAGRALSYILATPGDPEDRNHKVKFGLAAEASPRDIKEFRRRFGIACFGGYSSSENAITMVPVGGMPKDALGVPREGIDAVIVNGVTGEECARAVFEEGGRLLNSDDAIGEIVGRNVVNRFEGYYNNPEANAERTRRGWYWSGDLGYRDAEGIFYFAGRSGEWLRVDAENFAAAPVERILARYPDAQAVAVFAVPDERTADDQVMAAVEMSEGVEFDPVGFAEFLAAQPDLGTKWAPRYIRITVLPVGATNKIDKNTLRRQGWITDDPVYWRPERTIGYRLFTDDDRAQLEQRFTENLRSSARP